MSKRLTYKQQRFVDCYAGNKGFSLPVKRLDIRLESGQTEQPKKGRDD